MDGLGCVTLEPGSNNWGKGTRQNILHDAPQNVSFQRKYLERRFKNLYRSIDKDSHKTWVPRHPEVFLDESYCHLDHVSANRWVSKGGIVTEPGRKPLLVIFAAFVVYYDSQKEEVVGKFVDDSVHIWLANRKSGLPNAVGPSPDDDLWKNVPEEVREASSNIFAKDDDYHGNFTSEIFDRIFQTLCENLNKMNLRNCKIHLDGASYHFHRIHKKPTKSSKKSEIMKWFADTRNPVPADKTRNIDLVDHIKGLPEQPFSTSKTAEAYGEEWESVLKEIDFNESQTQVIFESFEELDHQLEDLKVVSEDALLLDNLDGDDYDWISHHCSGGDGTSATEETDL
ncbi:hypothetical protein BGZ76_004097 [Entomortierella beljakovae]|nr:hypothetical protein BGZ76_004097 [Entomortierella beljakovae]